MSATKLDWIGYIGPSISKGLKVKAAHVAPKRSDAMALKVKVRYGRNPHLTFTHVTGVPVAYAALFLNLNSPSRTISSHKYTSPAVYVENNFLPDCDS